MERRSLKKPLPVWPFVLVVLVLLGLGGWYWLRGRDQDLPDLPEGSSSSADSTPLLSPPPVPPLPAAEETDVLFRTQAEAISSHPTFLAWLREKDLIRRLASAIRSIANGQSPRVVWGFLAPQSRFQVIRKSNGLFLDHGSYQRYNLIADAVNSIDVAACREIYSWAHPMLESAYREIGEPGTSFKSTFVRAIQQILATPALPEEVSLQEGRNGAIFLFADPKLESLSDSQKHLLRMGPRNMRIIQEKLQQIEANLNLSTRGD